MDVGTLIGIVLAFVSLGLGLFLEGGNFGALVNIPAFLIVVPSTIGVSLACGLLKDFPLIIDGMKKAFLGKVHSPDEAIQTMVKFAEKARREGLLALEEAAKEIPDEFMK